VPHSTVERALRELGIKPAAYVGNERLYSEQALDAIRQHLAESEGTNGSK
jgi:hypothetical protein